MNKKFLSAILIILMVFSLYGCKSNGETPSNETTSATEETLVPKTTLAENGTPIFTLVNSKSASDDYISMLFDIQSSLKTLSGITFTRARMSEDDSVYELVFGPSQLEATKEVYNSIGFDGYAVKLVGNKIIIAAYTNENMKLAAEAFVSECISVEKKDGKSSVYYIKDIVYEGELGLFFDEENPLEEYTIVYDSYASNLVFKFAEKIEAHSGIKLDIISDSEAPREKEIILGNTTRDESRGALPTAANSHTSIRLRAINNKITVCLLDNEYSGVLDILVKRYLLNSPSLNFPKNVDDEFIKYLGDERQQFVSGSDIRIMSFNILSEEWDSQATLTPRISGVVGCMLYYKPDVIGIQEVSKKWHSMLRKYMSDEYVFVNPDILSSTDNNYTMLAYRKDTVRLIEDEVYFYSKGNSQRLRLVNMGYFEHIATGNKFVVTNTHYNANHTTAAAENVTRVIQATEFVQKVNEYIAKYNCPVISNGDYNCNEESEPYKKMIEGGIIFSAKLTAKTKGNVPKALTIDHILYTKGVTPLYFTTITDPYADRASDHYPIFAEFSFD